MTESERWPLSAIASMSIAAPNARSSDRTAHRRLEFAPVVIRIPAAYEDLGHSGQVTAMAETTSDFADISPLWWVTSESSTSM